MSKERYQKNGSKYFDTNIISLSPETKEILNSIALKVNFK